MRSAETQNRYEHFKRSLVYKMHAHYTSRDPVYMNEDIKK